MSDRQAPDLLDELLSLDESFSTEEDQAGDQPDAAAGEPRPRRRWWRRKPSAVPPEASDAEEGHESAEELDEPVVAEPEEDAPGGQQEQPAAEEDRAGDDVHGEVAPDEEAGSLRRGWWLGRRRTPLPEDVETEPVSAGEPSEPAVAEEPEVVEPEQEQPAAEEVAGEPEEGGDEPAADETAETAAPRPGGGRHLWWAEDEAVADDSADGSDPSRLGASVLPPTLGPRRAARARRRFRTRLLLGVGGAVLAFAAAATLLAPSFRDDPRPQRTASAAPTDALADPVRTLLVYGRSAKQESEATWMTLLSLNAETQKGSVVYVPAHTATEVPGRGLLGIGESLGSGPSLLEVSTETLLGVPVDARLQLTPERARALFQAVGVVSVDVPSELRVPAGEGHARLLIPQGPQQLAPDQLVSLLFRPGIEGDDAELGGRHLALWHGVLSQYTDDPVALANAVADAEPPLASPAFTERIGAFLSGLAEVPASSRTLANLPVKEVSVGGDQLYETDPEELSTFVGDTIGETDLAADFSRVQVLNGNGVPGIGVDVAEKLVGNGYRITLSGNADRLDYYWTRIVSYDSSPEGIAAAHRARVLLGAGTVQVSSQGQGIVDLTIVVGRDFLRTR